MTYSAVVFDLDGTLVNSLDDIAAATNAVLSDLGYPTHDIPAYRYFVGDGVTTLFSRVLPAEVAHPPLIAQCVARFSQVYDRTWNVRTRPYPGVAAMLAQLRDGGIPLAVLSNKPQLFTEKCVAEFFRASDFFVVVGQRDGVPHKPDPTGALEIARRLDVAPSACVYLGDTSVDMLTARRAGMFPVGALWGFRPREELEQHGAARLIADPRELPPIVLGL